MAGNNKKLLLDAKNIQTGDLEYAGIGIKELADKLGVTYAVVVNHLYEDKLLKGIYRLSRQGYNISMQKQSYQKVTESLKTEKLKPTSFPQELIDAWDEIHDNVRKIKSGKARRVPVLHKGKRKYHTVILAEREKVKQ